MLAVAVNGILLTRASHEYVAIAGFCVIALAAVAAAGAAVALRDPDSHGWLAGSVRRGYMLLSIVAVVSVLDMVAIFG